MQTAERETLQKYQLSKKIVLDSNPISVGRDLKEEESFIKRQGVKVRLSKKPLLGDGIAVLQNLSSDRLEINIDKKFDPYSGVYYRSSAQTKDF